MRLILLILPIFFLIGCDANPENSNVNTKMGNTANSGKNSSAAPVFTYTVVKTFKHDSKAFTQGLVFHDGFLYESTGNYGDSTLRKVDLETGSVVKKKDLDNKFFAEGMTVFNGKIYQITWREKTGFVYDVATLEPLKEFKYQGEGWGLTNDGEQLIMSDGTHILRFLDPETFTVTRTVPVMKENGQPLFLLNELEYVKGEIWANIWHSEETETGTTQGRLPNIGKPNYIARIEPKSGKVVGWIDLANISPDDTGDSENTLNGIAYDAEKDRIFVTGKKWKKLFEITVQPK